MYHVICCNGYYRVGGSHDAAEAVRLARDHRDGSYACIIQRDGVIVGNCVDGITGPMQQGPAPYDHATATGMYDR